MNERVFETMNSRKELIHISKYFENDEKMCNQEISIVLFVLEATETETNIYKDIKSFLLTKRHESGNKNGFLG